MVDEAAQVLESIFDAAYRILPLLSGNREADIDISLVRGIAEGTLPGKVQQSGQNLIPIVCPIDWAERGGRHF